MLFSIAVYTGTLKIDQTDMALYLLINLFVYIIYLFISPKFRQSSENDITHCDCKYHAYASDADTKTGLHLFKASKQYILINYNKGP